MAMHLPARLAPTIFTAVTPNDESPRAVNVRCGFGGIPSVVRSIRNQFFFFIFGEFHCRKLLSTKCLNDFKHVFII